MTQLSPRPIERKLAMPMSIIAAIFLVCLAGGLQSLRGGTVWPPKTHLFWWLALCLYPFFLLEIVIHWRLRTPRWPVMLIYAIIPPLRIICRDRETGEQVWLPWLGWRNANERLQDEVESHLSLPMIFVALLILPLLGIEYFWRSALENNEHLRLVVDTGQSIVWLAFTIEFLIMIMIVNKKLRYALQHWLDIFVICLPFLAFVRLARLGAVLRLQHVTKAARAYRLRGLAMRLYRSILLLNLVERVIRLSPERRLEKLRERLAEKEREMTDLREQIEVLEQEVAERLEALLFAEKANDADSGPDFDEEKRAVQGAELDAANDPGLNDGISEVQADPLRDS